MSSELPEGFVVLDAQGGEVPAPVPVAPVAKGRAPAPPVATDAGAALPEGFALEEQSVIPHLIDRAKGGTAALLGMVGGLPVSAINQGLAFLESGTNKRQGTKGRILSSEHPKAGIEDVTNAWNTMLGVKKIPAPKDVYGGVSKSNEYLGAIAEFLGGSLVPGMGTVAASGRKLATAITIALGDVAAGTSTVEGKEIGGKLAPSFGLSQQEGESLGATLGAFAGPSGVALAGQALLKTYSMGGNALAKADITGYGKEAQAAAANKLLMKELANGIDHFPQSKANLARSLELSKMIPGWTPTGAQASGAPGLIAMQKAVAQRSAEALGKAAARDAQNAKAIADFTEQSFPGVKRQTAIDPITGRSYTIDPVTDPARIKLQADRQVMQMEADKVTGELQQLTQQYRRVADNGAIGDALRSKYWEARGAAKKVQEERLADVYDTAKRIGIKEDMTDIRDSVNRLVQSDRQTFQTLPPLFSKVLQEYPVGVAATLKRVQSTSTGATKPIFRTEKTAAVPGKSEASFEEVHSLYKQANAEWAAATAAGDSTKAHYMAMIRDQLKGKVDKYGGPGYGELAEKFQGFNAGYAKYSRTFKEGAGGEIAKRDRFGNSTDSEDIVTKIILQAGDKKKGVQDFFEVYGSDAGAARLLHEGLTDSFAKAAVKGGQINPNAAAGWLKQHEKAMEELPALRELFGNSEKMARELVNRRLLLGKQRKVLDNTVLAKVAQSSNPEALITRALSDTKDGPKVLKALLVGAITPESKASVARAIVDVVSKQPGGLPYILANESTLRPVMEALGPGHWKNLKVIGEMEQIAGRIKAPTAVEMQKLQDIGEQAIGTSTKGLLSRGMAAAQHRISEAYAVADVGARWMYKIRSEELLRLREAAVFDPETAKLLATLTQQKTAPTKAQLMDLNRLGMNAGAVSSVVAAEQQGRITEGEREEKRKALGVAEKWRKVQEGRGAGGAGGGKE